MTGPLPTMGGGLNVIEKFAIGMALPVFPRTKRVQTPSSDKNSSGFHITKAPLLDHRLKWLSNVRTPKMTLPKPSSMSSTTQKDYAAQVRRQLAKCQCMHPEAKSSLIPGLLVQDLLERAPTLRTSTFRKYRAALHYALSVARDKASAIPSPWLAELYATALHELESARPTCLKRSSKTSAGKLKSCPEPMFQTILNELKKNPGNSALAGPASVAALLLLRGGFRPQELWGTHIEPIGPGLISVLVRNGKASNGRALGETRQVSLELDEEEMALALSWTGRVAALAQRYEPRKAMDRLARYFTDAGKRALKRDKVPSFYTLRHQATANMKAARMTRAEIAAVLGHASDSTAGRHYARRVSGSGKSVVKPDALKVRSVRETARGHSEFRDQRTRAVKP